MELMMPASSLQTLDPGPKHNDLTATKQNIVTLTKVGL